MATIGCASEYEAAIVNSSTQIPIKYLPWSQIKWDRRRNQISMGEVTIAGTSGGIECCNWEGGLFPWSQMLRIERNGSVVWDGPVTGWTVSNDGSVTITANDRFILTQKREVATYRYYDGLTNASTPNAIIRALVSDGNIGNIAYDPYTVTVVSASAEDERISREYLVERLDSIFACIDDIVQNTFTGYYCAVGSNVYVYEPTARFACGNVLGEPGLRIGEDTTIGRPSVTVDGLGMATTVYVGSSGQGVSGYPVIGVNSQFLGVYLSSLLEKATGESRVGDSADGQRAAARLSVSSATPAVNIERIRVNENFGSPKLLADLSNLLPGAHVKIDYENTCAFNVVFAEYSETLGVSSYRTATSIQYARMDMLETTVVKTEGGGIEETMLISLRPTIPLTTP